MRTLMTMSIFLLGCGIASAQVTMTPPTAGAGAALGATSPLGISGPTPSTPASPGDIPLGATQLEVGGLSPAPGPLAGSACSTVSSLNTFDGGGLGSGISGAGGSGATGCRTTSAAAGTASGLATPGSSGASATGTGGIPLGATEIDSGGLSPMVVAPAPDSNTMTPSP